MHHKSQDCDCTENGSINQECDDNGQCNCKDNVGGMKCDVCDLNTFGFPTCEGKDFENVNLRKVRFSKCEFFDKMWIFVNLN